VERAEKKEETGGRGLGASMALTKKRSACQEPPGHSGAQAALKGQI